MGYAQKVVINKTLVISLPGEVTEDELFNRLQQIKDGPEQPINNNPSPENSEDPVGMLIRSFTFWVHGEYLHFYVIYLLFPVLT